RQLLATERARRGADPADGRTHIRRGPGRTPGHDWDENSEPDGSSAFVAQTQSAAPPALRPPSDRHAMGALTLAQCQRNTTPEATFRRRDRIVTTKSLTSRLELKDSGAARQGTHHASARSPHHHRGTSWWADRLTERRSPGCASTHSSRSAWRGCSPCPRARAKVPAAVQRTRPERARHPRTCSSGSRCRPRPRSDGSLTATPSSPVWKTPDTPWTCSSRTTTSPPSRGRSTR